jgi:hypothetical protein
MSSRHAVAVPKSYRIDGFRDARRRRRSRWPELVGYRFLIGGLLGEALLDLNIDRFGWRLLVFRQASGSKSVGF